MNGKSAMFSTPAPFALSLSKGKRGVFQHPARHTIAVIGKLYRDGYKAAITFQRMKALRDGVFNGHGLLCIPAPLMLVPDLGLVLQEYIEGPDLGTLSLANYQVPLSLSAQWLARLHRAPQLDGLKAMSLPYVLGNVDAWCERVMHYLPDVRRLQLRRIHEILRRLASQMTSCEQVMVHGDYYYVHVLWDGHRVCIIDFDGLGIGDPAYDVGCFSALLDYKAYVRRAQGYALPAMGSFFVNSYLDSSPFNLSSRLPFYRAYRFLGLAARAVLDKRRNWLRVAGVLVDLAYQEVGR